MTHAAAADYLALRERVFRRIGAAGVMTLDVEPERLPIALVNRYLELNARKVSREKAAYDSHKSGFSFIMRAP